MNKNKTTTSINNRRAYFDYTIKDEYSAGIVLNGAETKSMRMHRASLQGAFVTINNAEVWLNNMQIMPTIHSATNLPESEQTRARKLLLNKKEINQLIKAKEQGNTIVPLKVLTKGRYIKIIIASAKGKKAYDKRALIKKRDEAKEIRRSFKYK